MYEQTVILDQLHENKTERELLLVPLSRTTRLSSEELKLNDSFVVFGLTEVNTVQELYIQILLTVYKFLSVLLQLLSLSLYLWLQLTNNLKLLNIFSLYSELQENFISFGNIITELNLLLTLDYEVQSVLRCDRQLLFLKLILRNLFTWLNSW